MMNFKEIDDPFARVRASTAWVVQRAQEIKWDLSRLEAFATTLDPAAILSRYSFEEDFHFTKGDAKALLEYVITLDALNFGSGFSPQLKQLKAMVQGSGYKTMATAIKEHLEAGKPLDPNFAASATPYQVAELVALPPDFPLVAMFTKSLNQLGGFVVERFNGDYAGLVTSSIVEYQRDFTPQPSSLPSKERGNKDKSQEFRPSPQPSPFWGEGALDLVGAKLVQTLVDDLPYFDDRSEYEGEQIYFYKRAQILVNDLYLAFKGQSFGNFGDISLLTTFADNLIPHFFRVEGILEYSSELAQKIDAGELIEAGSGYEVELRAFAVQTVEKLCQLVNEKAGSRVIFPAQLDVYLWNAAQNSHYKNLPRHRTHTYFY